jgi:hypothetical protein
MKDNEIMLNQWLIEDKECLSLYISLIDNLIQFYAADFKLLEKQGLRKITNKFNWNDIIRQNNNSNNFHEGSRESKRNNNNTLGDKSQINFYIYSIWILFLIIHNGWGVTYIYFDLLIKIFY